LGDRFGVFGAVVDLERFDRELGFVDILGVVDLLHRRDCTLGAPISAVRQEYWPAYATSSATLEYPGTPPARLAEAQGAVADREHRCGHGAVAAIAQQISPELSRSPEAVSQPDELHAAISTDPDHYQQTEFLHLKAHLEVDAIHPQIQVIGAG